MASTGPTPANFDQTEQGWYIGLAAPNVKGPNLAWLDPTRIYSFQEGLNACVEDLVHPFLSDPIDVVAGIDATGFILGAAIAHRLNAGFLAIRKAGHLCVDTDSVPYSDYQKREKALEIRKFPFAPGSRVLIVDQWIETGGTMKAALELIKQNQGSIVGVAAVCIEDSDGGKYIRQQYKYSQCAPSSLQEQINNHYLDSFKLFS